MQYENPTSAHRSDFSRVLPVLLVGAALGCTPTATPPESTPVYAEEVAPGVEPVPVERQSVNRPEAQPVSAEDPTKEEVEADGPAAGQAEKATTVETSGDSTPKEESQGEADAASDEKKEGSQDDCQEKPTCG